jgi:hypothetical protein
MKFAASVNAGPTPAQISSCRRLPQLRSESRRPARVRSPVLPRFVTDCRIASDRADRVV